MEVQVKPIPLKFTPFELIIKIETETERELLKILMRCNHRMPAELVELGELANSDERTQLTMLMQKIFDQLRDANL